MTCPECKADLQPQNKLCGALVLFACRCGFQRSDWTGQMNMGQLHDWAMAEAQFRRIVRKAMINAGLKTVEAQCAFMEWLIGEDYSQLPYCVSNKEQHQRMTKEVVEDWVSRIQKNSRLYGVTESSSVYRVIHAAAEKYMDNNRVLMTMVN